MFGGITKINTGRVFSTSAFSSFKLKMIVLWIFFLMSCQPKSDFKSENFPVNPWSAKPFLNARDDFRFIIISDRTNGLRDTVLIDAVEKINLLKPDFVMSVGDLIQGYSEDSIRLAYEWKEWDSLIAPLEMKFFPVAGNHDISNVKMLKLWKEKFGPTYYYFIYKDVLFLCMNTEDHINHDERYFDKKQIAYFLKVLQKNDQVKWTFVFMHQPSFFSEDNNWKKLEKELQKRNYTLFAGHIHQYTYSNVQGNDYITLGTTGGSSGLRGPEYGEFDHITQVSMIGGKPYLTNLALDGLFDKNLNPESTQQISRQVIPKIHYEISPIFEKNPDQNEYLSYFKIANKSKQEIWYDFELRYHTDYEFEMTARPETLLPGEKRQFPWKIKKLQSAVQSPISLKIHYSVSDEISNEVLSQSIKYKINPEPQLEVQIKNEKYKLDGILNEWSKLPFSINENGNDNGSGNASAKFGVAATSDSLYIGINVKDEHIMVDPKLSYHQQDAVLLLLDGRPLSISSVNKGGYFFPVLYLELYPLIEEDGTSKAFAEWILPPEVSFFCKESENGYTAEVAIDKNFFTKQDNDFENFRLNIEIFDYNLTEKRINRFSWKPDWTSSQNLIGSGTFFISK